MMTLQLSNRLQFIANLISGNVLFADIGSDHAYLPCYVCLQDPHAQSIAGEVAKGPYERALQTVAKYDLHERIDVRLGNGLDIIQTDDRIEEIVIAGMGGTLISTILDNGKEKLQKVNRLIIQPNNNELRVRETFLKLGFLLTDEYILEENNLIYEILVAEKKEVSSKKKDPYDINTKEKQLLFGPILYKEKSSVFIKKWQQERKKLEKTIQQMKRSEDQTVQMKIKSFEERINWIEEVIS